MNVALKVEKKQLFSIKCNLKRQGVSRRFLKGLEEERLPERVEWVKNQMISLIV